MLHKETLFKLYPRRYCACAPSYRGRQNCAIFRNKWLLHTEAIRPTIRNYNGYITTFSRTRVCTCNAYVGTPWSFAAKRMIHVHRLPGKLSRYRYVPFPSSSGKYREMSIIDPRRLTDPVKNQFHDVSTWIAFPVVSFSSSYTLDTIVSSILRINLLFQPISRVI